MIRYLKRKTKVEKCFSLHVMFQFDEITLEIKIYIQLNKITYCLGLLLHHNSCNRNCAAHKDKIFSKSQRKKISVSHTIPKSLNIHFKKMNLFLLLGTGTLQWHFKEKSPSDVNYNCKLIQDSHCGPSRLIWTSQRHILKPRTEPSTSLMSTFHKSSCFLLTWECFGYNGETDVRRYILHINKSSKECLRF